MEFEVKAERVLCLQPQLSAALLGLRSGRDVKSERIISLGEIPAFGLIQEGEL